MAAYTTTLLALNVKAPLSGNLFIEGLKAGMLSFGGAYTAIPFLQDSMVGTYPAITPQAFLDGLALGNVIPAPLVIFGTFLGMLAGSVSGALLMTAGIFLPALPSPCWGTRIWKSCCTAPHCTRGWMA